MATNPAIPFVPILADHRLRYPHLQLQDLYKLLHQAVLGSEHAIQDVSQAQTWLEQEASDLAPGFMTPLIEPIAPRGKMLRVHLRPYLACTLNLAPLLSGFIHTAEHHQGSLDGLQAVLSQVETVVDQADLPFSVPEIREFFQDMDRRGFPAVHHSETYVENYQPAYRVVSSDFIAPILAACHLT